MPAGRMKLETFLEVLSTLDHIHWRVEPNGHIRGDDGLHEFDPLTAVATHESETGELYTVEDADNAGVELGFTQWMVNALVNAADNTGHASTYRQRLLAACGLWEDLAAERRGRHYRVNQP